MRRRIGGRSHARRRASVLVLVVTLLGILFVLGIAFMGMMNFEAGMKAIEERRTAEQVGVDELNDVILASLVENLFYGSGATVASTLGSGLGNSFAEMPVVHGLLAQVEPQPVPDPVFPGLEVLAFTYFTDPLALKGTGTVLAVPGEPFSSVYAVPLNGGDVPPAGIEFPNDPANGRVRVDADGDGIADTFQVAVSELGLSEALDAFRTSLNPESNPDGEIYLGQRVIPHGAFVNLNESHPNMIFNLMNNVSGFVVWTEWESFRPPYSPLVEERMLRRRMSLPPRSLSPSELTGNPFIDQEQYPDGDGVLRKFLFPPNEVVYETGLDGAAGHRSSAYAVDEMYESIDPEDDFTLWAMRMNPIVSQKGAPGDENIARPEYDRRHLFTTVGHTDLLARRVAVDMTTTGLSPSGPPVPMKDILLAMREAQKPQPNDPEVPTVRFPRTDYPHDLLNGSTDPDDDCENAADLDCVFDPRKGRLRLSLAWLQDALEDGVIDETQRNLLVQDTFTMMLKNARGPMPGVPGDVNPDAMWDLDRTAASLTANLIDFMDKDLDVPSDPNSADLHKPTRIAIRSSDFGDMNTVGCFRGATGALNCFDEGSATEYVYGLERQVYITEIAAHVTAQEDGALDVAGSAYGIELFNPYDEPIWLKDSTEHPSAGNYVLHIGTDGSMEEIILPNGVVNPGGFLVIVSTGDAAMLGAGQAAFVEIDDLAFESGDEIYLTRKISYPLGIGLVSKFVVVDQFHVGGGLADVPQDPEPIEGELESIERESVTENTPWMATLPADGNIRTGEETSLGFENSPTVEPYRPVEVNFANTGSFVEITATDDNGVEFIVTDGSLPTTGSLLLLMRHANRAISDLDDDPDAGLAFTTQLAGELPLPLVYTINPNTGVGKWVQPGGASGKFAKKQIDNGRMPVFDVAKVHRLDPSNETAYPVDVPGALGTLPWGQLIFDYFTVLPLSNPSPYAHEPGDTEFTIEDVAPYTQPRVDLDGLRVYGVADINAAPWMVLAGLPLVPMEKIPAAFREEMGLYLGLDPAFDDEAFSLGDHLAQAIVAYREAREVKGLDGGFTTGDYNNTSSTGPQLGRGWRAPTPAARRGFGFMSVGELANVRHPLASESTYTIDGNAVMNVADKKDGYVKAIAALVALGDWVSVRSQVFTVYGTLRGEMDEEVAENESDPNTRDELRAADVDSRAVRFQQTVDRLPTYLGESLPLLIGERYVGAYTDTTTD
ncbi:MAG: hypothetical protein IID36_04775 [Planctomycetes bacterium]|nr:hypothetical protein [Planctomycetota bacterium]